MILLDLDLPDIPGAEVLQPAEGVAGDPGHPGHHRDGRRHAGSDAALISEGASAYVTKPFDVAVLLTAIDEALGP